MVDTGDPISGPPPHRIRLESAPLVRVLAQLSFDEILSINKKDYIAPFQENIRDRYPVLRAEEAGIVNLANQEVQSETVWRFYERAGDWRISLGTSFISIETKSYTVREDFVERIRHAVDAADRAFKINSLTRVGVRYVDRVQGAEFEQIHELVEPPMLGILSNEYLRNVPYVLSQMLTPVPEGALSARWGIIPENSTPEPNIIEPIANRSWILDIDAFAPEQPGPTIEVADVQSVATNLAQRVSAFFRWAVTPKFMEVYGGKNGSI